MRITGMFVKRRGSVRLKLAAAIGVSALGGLTLMVRAQQEEQQQELPPNHAECLLFSPRGDAFRKTHRAKFAQSDRTMEVAAALARGSVRMAAKTSADASQDLDKMGAIDQMLFSAMQTAGVTPAGRTNDYEFIRRVTLDLTGRVPAYDRLLQFIQDPAADKRAKYIEELLASTAYLDKWTMFFGDLFENTLDNLQVRRYADGRNAFQKYIKDSLASNKKYNVMVTEMIANNGANSWEQGEINWTIGGQVMGGPRTGQDNFDQLAANVAEKFLGLAHENCILCHDGRRHLDPLSVWGKYETRRDSWELAAFFSKATVTRVNVPGAMNGQPYYFRVSDTPNAPDYPLNTTTGNRPARQPIGNTRNIAPSYPFSSGGKPGNGESYRAALARFITADPQFARATVNYIWKQFFGRGIVEPVNQFDPDRLDPKAELPEGWTLQPTNPQLLEALAKQFTDSGFDLKNLIRQIANSEAYQLAAWYDGEWKSEWETLFARHFVRRLWGEEILDAIVQSSGIGLNHAYQATSLPQMLATGPVQATVPWTMQLPETRGLPLDRNTRDFLDSFLRGNRVDADRRGDGSVAQVLNLMNDTLVMSRTRAAGTGATASLARRLLTKYPQPANDNLLVNEAFLNILSRPATQEELIAGTVVLAQGGTAATRQAKVEDLLWALYNKVDMVYNY